MTTSPVTRLRATRAEITDVQGAGAFPIAVLRAGSGVESKTDAA